MSAALAARKAPETAPAPGVESFDSFLARNLRRAPRLVPLAIIFLLLRTAGSRAGALMLIAASAALLPFTVIRPDLGVYALTLNFVNEWDSYYRLQTYLPVSLPVLFDAAVALGIAVRLQSTKERLGLDAPQIRLLAAYVALVILSVLASDTSTPYLWQSFRTSFLIRPTIFLFVILLVREPSSLYRLLLVLIVAHTLLMATGLSDLIQKGTDALYRVRGTVTAINYLSYVCVVIISILIALYVYSRDRLSKLALFALGLVTILVSLRTLSRSGYYAFGATLLFIGIKFIRNPRTVLVAVTFGSLFYLMTPSGLTERFTQVESLATTDRYYLSRIALRMALDHPVVGVGWHAYETRFPEYDVERHFRKAKAPHSLYLAIAATCGFPALFVYMAMFGVTFRELVGVERDYRRAGELRAFGYFLAIGLQSALVGHFVFGLAGSYGDSYYAFFVLALSFVLVRLHRRRPAQFLP